MAERLDRRKDMEELLGEIAKDVHAIAVTEYKSALTKSGKEYTGELRRNFESGLINISADISAEIVFSFDKYGRWRDLKYVEYSGYKKPNNKGKKYGDGNDQETPEAVEIFEDWIRAKGLQKFKYVQGYVGSSSVPVTDRAIKRMAWGMYLGRIWKARVVNKKTQWYAKTTPKILKLASPMVAERVGKMLVDGKYSSAWAEV